MIIDYKVTQDQITTFFNLFRGLDSAHGRFIPSNEETGTEKVNGKSETIREETTPQMWQSHLEGRVGLGIVPICHDNTCVWGAIDVDVYPLDFLELLNKIQRGNYPLVTCQSKSGGAHLFLFLKESHPAGQVQKYLRIIASKLGLGGAEIFPKQSKILAERGDVGNWLNMPYFGSTRLGIAKSGHLTLDEFLDLAKHSRTNISNTSANGTVDFVASTLTEAPPCLQTMELQGFPEHSRNQSLFGLGVYAKKAFPGTWRRVVENYNRTFFEGDPLSANEVESILKSLDKKEYFYRCHEDPMVSFCNTAICRTRKFGISTIANMPVINSVTKLLGDTIIWFIDVEGGRLEMTSEELFDNKKFQVKCLDTLNILPHRMATIPWTSYLQKLIDTAIVVKQEDAMDYKDQLWDLFTQYVKNRITDNPTEIDLNRVYYSPTTQEIWFKSKDFGNFLARKQFKLVKTLVSAYMRDKGLRRVSKQFGGKIYNFSAINFGSDLALIKELDDIKQKDEEEVI